MNNDKFPKLSASEDDEDDIGSIIKRSSPEPFDFRSLISEATVFTRHEDEDEDEEEETTEDKKKKKFAQLLKKIFPKSIDEEPALSVEPQSAEELSNPMVPNLEYEFSEINSPPAYESEADKQTLPEIEHEDKPEVPLESQITEINIEQFRPIQPVEIPAPITAPPIIAESFNYPAPISSHQELSAPVSKETQIVEKQKPAGALLAFLASEFLSRRRDKKLEKSLKKQSKEINNRIEGIKSANAATSLESLSSILRRSNYSKESIQNNSQTSVIHEKLDTQNNNNPTEINNNLIKNIESIEQKPAKLSRDFMVETSKELKKDEKQCRKASPQGGSSRGISHFVTQVLKLGKTQSSPETTKIHQPPLLQNNDYKKSIQLGAGTAILILIAFIIIYTTQ